MEIITDKERKWAYEMWCIGYLPVQIAEALGVSEKTIKRTFKRHGLIRIRPVLKVPDDVRSD